MLAAELLRMNALSGVRAGTGPAPTLYATNHILLLTRFSSYICSVKTLRNHVERILNIFDQERKDSAHSYLLNIDEADYSGDEDRRLIFHRLLTAGASREMRERMEMEDLMLRDYDERGVELLRQKKQLQEKDSQLQEKDSQLQEKDFQLQEKDSQLQEQSEQLRQTIRLLKQAQVAPALIAERLGITPQDVELMAREG